MHLNKRNIWLAVILAPVILIPVAVGGLYLYTSATAPLLHPDPHAELDGKEPHQSLSHG